MFKNDDLIKMIKGRKGEKNVSLYLYEVSKIEKHFSALLVWLVIMFRTVILTKSIKIPLKMAILE